MKASDRPQSATSLPHAPRDGEAARFRRYLVTMGIRIGCFILAVVIQPFGWWTWVLLAGAIFLPYFAVVVANVGMDASATTAEAPAREITAAPPAPAAAASDRGPAVADADPPQVIRLFESLPRDASSGTPEKSADDR